jgi:hypothetical protein
MNTEASNLAQKLIQEINSNTVTYNSSEETDPRFFEGFVKKHSPFFSVRFSIDSDLLAVLSRQIMILLKKGQIITLNNGSYQVDFVKLESIQDINLFLFKVFWNTICWLDFFPSMPQVADFLQNTRHHIARVFHSKEGRFYLDSVAVDYLVSSNYRYRNELVFVSFFDFSVTSWLSYFGICKFHNRETMERVALSLSPFGYKTLSSLF